MKVRYYTDRRLTARIIDPPAAMMHAARANDWTELRMPELTNAATMVRDDTDDAANGGIRREPELPEEQEIVPSLPLPPGEFEFDDSSGEDAAAARRLNDRLRANARQASMDPNDGIEL